MTPKPPKARPCDQCGSLFIPYSHLMAAKVCSRICAGRLVKRAKVEARARALQEKREDKARLEALEPISTFEKRAERVVNEYVRLRDKHKGLGCVSCEKPASWDGQWHASHFRSVGAATAVRYNLWNIHSACWICNKLYSGRIDQYEPEIIRRIGQEKLDWLRAQNKVTKYSREYLERLRAVFAKKVRRMKKRLAHA